MFIGGEASEDMARPMCVRLVIVGAREKHIWRSRAKVLELVRLVSRGKSEAANGKKDVSRIDELVELVLIGISRKIRDLEANLRLLKMLCRNRVPVVRHLAAALSLDHITVHVSRQI
ncbi:hypothetical protein Scep_021952 [Stephania cephalantha]|uniref:Uncharacterized protein n=1 Tax=Stephania cephalantha TaxID=152367 RepID=A0AAP0F9H3_9MAGN